MKRLLASTVAALALLTACGVAEDTTAATVGDREISVADVEALAASSFIASQAEQSGAALVTSSDGTSGATKARIALRFLVETALYEREVERLGDSVTADDQQSAEESVSAYEQQSGQLGKERKVLVAYVAARAAVVRNLDLPEADVPEVPEVDPATVATPEKIAAFYEQYKDQLGEIACLDGFAVPSENQAAAQALVDAGTPVPQIVADASLSAQGFSENAEESCIPTGQISEQLATLATDTPVGTWATATIEQQGGALVVFLRPNSRSAATLDNPTVVDIITEALQQQAQQEQQQAQEAASAAQAGTQQAAQGELDKIVAKAEPDIEIDSRYGSFDPNSLDLVVAPPTPRAAGPTTTLPVLGGQ